MLRPGRYWHAGRRGQRSRGRGEGRSRGNRGRGGGASRFGIRRETARQPENTGEARTKNDEPADQDDEDEENSDSEADEDGEDDDESDEEEGSSEEASSEETQSPTGQHPQPQDPSVSATTSATSQSGDRVLTPSSGSSDKPMEDLAKSMTALKFVPRGVRFGRGRGGFPRR